MSTDDRDELIRILRQTAAPSIRRAELGADAILDSSWVAGLVAERQELQAEIERWATGQCANELAEQVRLARAERDDLRAELAALRQQFTAARAGELREAADAKYVGSITVRAFQAWLRRRAAAVLSDDGSEMTKAPRPADAERG